MILTVHGDLLLDSTSRTMRTALVEQLLDRGRVIVDLSATTVREPSTAALFPAALAQAGGWPLARLVLTAPDPSTTKILQGNRVHLTVPLARDVGHARLLLGVRPQRVVRSHELPCIPTAPALARSFVNVLREEWQLPDELCDIALTVATVLVSNAVEHARTSCVLYLAFDARRLHIAVRDQLPESYGLPRRGPHGDRG